MERSEGDMSLKNPVQPPGIDPETVRLVAQRLNYYANPGPIFCGGREGNFVLLRECMLLFISPINGKEIILNQLLYNICRS
jgi:hypothetical protein